MFRSTNPPLAPPSGRGTEAVNTPCGAFTLVELLVVIAVIALLIAFILPALGSGVESGRASVCLSNLRQMHLICQSYADENRGYGPAIGQPYADLPNWALVVQAASGRGGSTGAELYTSGRNSALVCPTSTKINAREMQRTYAMNATGHAGLTRPDGSVDPSNFDTPLAALAPGVPPAHIRIDAVDRPDQMCLMLDSRVDASQALTPGAPPPTRTASVLDFRNPSHVANRPGNFHALKQFQFVAFDGSAKPLARPHPWWDTPLP